LYSLLRDGSLRSVTIGTRRLVPHSELEAYVARLLEAA
jgi:excisionase family DNA binding protein